MAPSRFTRIAALPVGAALKKDPSGVHVTAVHQ